MLPETPETANSVVTSEVLSAWLKTIERSINYFSVITDTIYHNRDAASHIAKLNRVKIDMASIQTYLEHGS